MDTLQGSWPERGSPAAQPDPVPDPEPAPRRVVGALAFLGDTIRRRRGARIALWALVGILAVSGTWMIAKPLITDIWAGRIQDRLEDDFVALEEASPPGATGYTAPLAEGSALTRLVIPKIGLRIIVVEGEMSRSPGIAPAMGTPSSISTA